MQSLRGGQLHHLIDKIAPQRRQSSPERPFLKCNRAASLHLRMQFVQGVEQIYKGAPQPYCLDEEAVDFCCVVWPGGV